MSCQYYSVVFPTDGKYFLWSRARARAHTKYLKTPIICFKSGIIMKTIFHITAGLSFPTENVSNKKGNGEFVCCVEVVD